MPLTPAEKLDARQTNEGIKLSANFANTTAVGFLVGGFISPAANGRELGPAWVAGAVLGAALIHVMGRLLLTTLKPEE